MELKDIQKEVVSLYKRYKPRRNLNQRMLTLMEEVGELAREVLIQQGCKKVRPGCIKSEVSQIFENILMIANMLEVDLEKQWTKNRKKKIRKDKKVLSK